MMPVLIASSCPQLSLVWSCALLIISYGGCGGKGSTRYAGPKAMTNGKSTHYFRKWKCHASLGTLGYRVRLVRLPRRVRGCRPALPVSGGVTDLLWNPGHVQQPARGAVCGLR